VSPQESRGEAAAKGFAALQRFVFSRVTATLAWSERQPPRLEVL
jgi:hypothetical protein